MNSPGWAVELVGEKFDVDDFREMLPPPFDPWVEDYSMDGGSVVILRTGTHAGKKSAHCDT
jgi:hypothetical protein